MKLKNNPNISDLHGLLLGVGAVPVDAVPLRWSQPRACAHHQARNPRQIHAGDERRRAGGTGAQQPANTHGDAVGTDKPMHVRVQGARSHWGFKGKIKSESVQRHSGARRSGLNERRGPRTRVLCGARSHAPLRDRGPGGQSEGRPRNALCPREVSLENGPNRTDWCPDPLWPGGRGHRAENGDVTTGTINKSWSSPNPESIKRFNKMKKKKILMIL